VFSFSPSPSESQGSPSPTELDSDSPATPTSIASSPVPEKSSTPTSTEDDGDEEIEVFLIPSNAEITGFSGEFGKTVRVGMKFGTSGTFYFGFSEAVDFEKYNPASDVEPSADDDKKFSNSTREDIAVAVLFSKPDSDAVMIVGCLDTPRVFFDTVGTVDTVSEVMSALTEVTGEETSINDVIDNSGVELYQYRSEGEPVSFTV